MIQKETLLNVCDNSGVSIVKCIGTFKKKIVNIGDIIVISVQSLNTSINNLKKNPIKKGDIYKAVIVNTKKGLRRKNRLEIRFIQNSCILLDDKFIPLGNRISTTIPYEIKKKGHLKLFSLSKYII